MAMWVAPDGPWTQATVVPWMRASRTVAPASVITSIVEASDMS